MSRLFERVMNVLYYFLGPPLLFFLIPIIVKRWTSRLAAGNNLRGKVVVITGASSGLGEALAHELYRRGCKLILTARRVDQLNRVKADLLALSTRGETFTPEVMMMDLGELSGLESAGRALIQVHGRVDILVNNAGVSSRGRVQDTDMAVHQRIMTVNYFGQICLTKVILSDMLAQRSGHIVMVNSVQGKIGIPFRSAYSASKHALQAYSDSLRAEVAGSGVQVTVVNPGYVNTSLSLNALTASGDLYAKMDKSTAGGYTSEEVAKVISSAISNADKELIIAPLAPRVAIMMRNICPSLFFLIMQRRAAKNEE